MKIKIALKILAISIAVMMVVSCVTPCIAVADRLTDNSYDIFPSENITADNTPFSLSSNTIYVPRPFYMKRQK